MKDKKKPQKSPMPFWKFSIIAIVGFSILAQLAVYLSGGVSETKAELQIVDVDENSFTVKGHSKSEYEVGVVYGNTSELSYSHPSVVSEDWDKSTGDFTVKVDGLIPDKTYFVAKIVRTKKYGPNYKVGTPMTITTIPRTEPVKEAIDLGLSVKWASCNIGANSIEKYGAFYQFCYTSETDDYNTHIRKSYDYAKYVSDMAKDIWKDGWRLPTQKEFLELKKKCKWEWEEINGKDGYRVTSKNGNSIFLPACGYQYERKVKGRNELGAYHVLKIWGEYDYKKSFSFDKNTIGGVEDPSSIWGYAIRAVHD